VAEAVTRRTFPIFSELPPELRTPEALDRLWRDPPVVRMTLEDAERERGEIRGVYETSAPDVSAPRCFKHGREFCQWLGREPDWRKGHLSHLQRDLVLYEVTPVEEAPGLFCNLRWRIEIVGEAEQRVEAALRSMAQRAVSARLALAG
jgi:hypothetical protein